LWVLLPIILLFNITITVVDNLRVVKERNESKSERNELKQDIAKISKEREELKKDITQVYKDTLTKYINGEIVLPPDFENSNNSILSTVIQSSQGWADNLKDIKGLDKQDSELEYLALAAKAKEIDSKLLKPISEIKNVIIGLVNTLNENNTFNGAIHIEIYDLPNKFTPVKTKFEDEKILPIKLLKLNLPDGEEWYVTLYAAYISAEMPTENFEVDLEFNKIWIESDREKLLVGISSENQDKYLIHRINSRHTWPEGLQSSFGDINYITKAIKIMFEHTIRWDSKKRIGE